MRIVAALGAVLLCCAVADAAELPDDWRPVAAGDLSLMAPPGTAAVLAQSPGVRTWTVRAAQMRVVIRSGPTVGDGDDSEPRVCYAAERIVVDGRAAALRVARENPRLDCPENYASLYIATPRAGGSAIYVSAQAADRNALAALRPMLATLHISN